MRDTAWCATPVDRFILAGLEAKSWQPAPPVARERLIRRAYFDLWGLPPTPEEVARFVADRAPDAYARLVDQLLASPRYGERWARYWLDLVRFAETNGYERDALKTGAWRYRDWVIAALNNDKPYDRFVCEQLAGDELPDASEETRIATGFLRVGTFDDEPNDKLKYKYEQLDDLIHATSTAFLAITLKCARCHDHKFDAIPQSDYYGMLNFFIGGKPVEGELLAYTDEGPTAPPVQLLQGGDPTRLGETVPAAFLSMLPSVARVVNPPPAGAATSGARLQLAQWITDPRHPLTARVMVNRLWQHHFGEGLSRTPDNFGAMGSEPTHPELLDWLADEFVARGWHVKRMHKLIMLSSAYQMDASHPREAEYSQADFANERWWRRNRRRLEAEPLRDAMLAVSGQLNPAAGGPSFFPPASGDALEGLSKKDDAWGVSPPTEQRRRSIYMMTKRSLLLPLMTTFDFADTTQPCSQRNISTVAPQALALLNNDFVHAQSAALADRVLGEGPGELTARIERAWQLALSRAPTADELAAAQAHVDQQRRNFAAQAASQGRFDSTAGLERQALTSLCHVLLNTNEFIYID
ncbi:MAG: DUF1549 and DUF1553 domain-containing protein [Pirellulales bacterium]